MTETPFPSKRKRKTYEDSGNDINRVSRSSSKRIENKSTDGQQRRMHLDRTSATPKTLHVNAKRHKIEHTLKEEVDISKHDIEIVFQNKTEESVDSEDQSPSQYHSHLFTGDLLRACTIM